MSLTTYNRRGCPEFDPGWFDTEHGNIQRALKSLDGVAIQHVTAPLSFDAATGTLSTSAASAFTVHRTSNITNATTTPASCGLVVPVSAGLSYRVQYSVLVGNSHGTANPVALSLSYPGASVIAALVTSFTSSSAVSAALSFVGSGSPMDLGATWVNFATTAVMTTIDLIIRNASAGNVDLLFAAANVANTITIGDGSCAVAQGL